MAVKSLLYRGLEIYPLVFPRRPTVFGRAHNYDDGFDAAVRIHEPNSENTKSRSRVFRLSPEDAYASAGDARRASTAYAEQVIDTSPQKRAFFDLGTKQEAEGAATLRTI